MNAQLEKPRKKKVQHRRQEKSVQFDDSYPQDPIPITQSK